MFMEIVTGSRREAALVEENSRMFADPPAGLLAAVAWESGDDDVTTLMVWETPKAHGDFSFERMMPLFESGVMSEVKGKPERLTPVKVYLRPGDP